MDLMNLDEKLLTLSEACRCLPSKPSPATLWRWRTKGVNGVRLECVRVGRTWYVTRASLLAFVKNQSNSNSTTSSPASSPVCPAGRSEALTRRLREAGCLAPSDKGRPARRGQRSS